jgi:endonuclease-3
LPRKTRAQKERAAKVLDLLEAEHPDARCALEHDNPLQLLVATILSAQCTDERVNQVTPVLFARYPTARRLAEAPREEIEAIIRPTGFFRQKAGYIQGAAQAIAARPDGGVPRTMKELLELPGVARKTANVVLGVAYDVRDGVVVDTHVGRLARRLRFTRESNPVKIEADLMALVPRERWVELAHLLIFHGRRVCAARRPACDLCVVSDLCPSSWAAKAPPIGAPRARPSAATPARGS